MRQNNQILITNTYFYPLDKKQWSIAQPYPPLGTIWAASCLREKGYTIQFHDSCLQENPDNLIPYLENIKPKYLVIYDDGFNYLTKMCLTVMRESAFRMIELGKKTGCTVILSSSDSTDHYEEYHEAGADFVIHGEGEITLIELLQCLENGEKPDNITGISSKKEHEVIKNAPRPVLKDLDSLPLPAWDLVDINAYRRIWMKNHGYFSLNLATTRGCPYRCNWCAKPIYGNRYNSRSPENVIEEIEILTSKYAVNYFWMCDDIFGLKPNWVQRFRDLRKEKGLNFQYKIQSRVDLMLKEDNLFALAESGADVVWVGAESGSQKILDAMDKGTKVEQIYEATQKLKSKGVKVAFFLQFGYLGETLKDIRKTIKMVLDLVPDDIGISVSYPLPGTKFYETVKNELGNKANWSDSDDLDMMFHNTFSPVFYKILHRYVHNRYRIKKGWLSFQSILRSPLTNSRKHLRDIARMIYHIPFAVYHNLRLSTLSRVIP